MKKSSSRTLRVNEGMIPKIVKHIDSVVSSLIEIKNALNNLQGTHEKTTHCLIDLVKLNSPEVDQVLQKHGITIREGKTTIFPRENPTTDYPQVIEFPKPSDDDGDTN
jgi:hypothetical protein